MKKDIIWNSLGTAAWSFLSLFLLIVVTRINGIQDSGLFSFAFAVSFITFTISCFGGRAYQVSDYKNTFKTGSYVSLRLITSTATIIIAILFILLNNYEATKAALILILVSQRAIDAVADVFYGIMQKRSRLYSSGQSLLLKSIASFIVFSIINILTKDLLLAALSLPVISLLFLVLYDIPTSRGLEKFTIEIKYVVIRKILKANLLPFSITIFALVFVNIARFFIDLYHPELQGYFGIIIMPLSLITLFFSFIYTPAIVGLTEKFNTGKILLFRKSINKIITIIFTSSAVLSFFTYLFGAPVLALLFNVDFSNYVIELVLVVIIGASVSLSSLFSNIGIVARKLKPISMIYLMSCILLVIASIFTIESYGIRGAIVTYIFVSFLQTVALSTYYQRLTKS